MDNRSHPTHSDKRPARSSSDPQRIIRLVVLAVLCFTLAIALPFLGPVLIFPTILAHNDGSAPVVVDGRSIFRVADTATTASADARAALIGRNLQKFANQQQQPEINVEVTKQGSLATVDLGYPTLEDPKTAFDFTVTQDDTTDTLTPEVQAQIWAEDLKETFAQAKQQRQRDYIRLHLWQVFVVPVVAAIAHWLAGLLWRGHLRRFLQSLMMEGKDDKGTFTAVNLFLNATLLLLRIGIWIGAFLYATNLFPNTRQFSQRVISQLSDSFTAETIPLGNAPISILDIFRVLILVLLVTIAAGVTSNILKRRVLQETGINRGVQEAISIILRYTLIFVGVIIVLQASGINLSSLTLLASALGVGAGLGLQNIVKDIGSGLVLVFERPVQVGEFVQIGEQTGTVERIGARSSEIRTLDQVSIIVPNSQFLENEVVNWSHRNPISRIRIPVGVAYKSDPEQVRRLLLRTGNQHPDVLAAPPALVLFREFGDSALLFDLLVWVAQPSRQYIIKSDLFFMLAKALREEGIEIPFPQRDVHMIWHERPTQTDLPDDSNE
ncbi:MAG: mechanosensitive ion channel domain-containing protein [Phormidesmis sp.]